MAEYDEMDFCGELCNFAEELIKKAKPKWIHVTERLPDEYQRVLVSLESKVQVVARIKDNCWVISWNNSLCPNVTHWMPLPEPPKED